MSYVTVSRSFKIKLYPTLQQRNNIERTIGANRWLWNHLLAYRTQLHETAQQQQLTKDERVVVNRFTLNYYITQLKRQPDTAWLADAPSQTLQNTTHRLHLAFSNFFTRVKRGERPGYPRFKRKKQPVQSFTYPQGYRFNGVGSKVYLPTVGWVKCRGYRQLRNPAHKQLIVKLYNDGRIEASCSVTCDNQATHNTTSLSVGIDVGTRKFAVSSGGDVVYPLHLEREWSKLQHHQRQLGTALPNSNNRSRTYDKIAKLHRKIYNKRTDWLHKISHRYLHYSRVYVEDLAIRRMTASAVGTVDNPNLDSRRKSRLNHTILQQGWGMFFDILQYKLAERSSVLIKVDPMYTSQQCAVCDHIDSDNRHGEQFRCLKCGYADDADHNASVNIWRRGYQSSQPYHPRINVA